MIARELREFSELIKRHRPGATVREEDGRVIVSDGDAVASFSSNKRGRFGRSGLRNAVAMMLRKLRGGR